MVQSDQELMEQILKRDAHAFETLFIRYREGVYRYLIRTVRNKSAADDLIQEVFLRIWTRAEQWSGQGKFKSWLFRIATNLALNYLRSVRRRKEQPLEIPTERGEEDENPAPSWMIDSAALGPDAVFEQAEERGLLRRLIDKLPEEKREVVRLVSEAEMDISEIAKALNIPEGTVKSRLHYATRQLAEEWKDKIE